VSLRTGKPLEKFPETSAGIAKLTCKSFWCCVGIGRCFNADLVFVFLVVSIDNMLNALDAERSGNEATKREKLRVQIGLKPNPA